MALQVDRTGNHTSAVLLENGIGDGHGASAQELLDALLAAKAELPESAWVAARVEYPDDYGTSYRLVWPWHRGAPSAGK